MKRTFTVTIKLDKGDDCKKCPLTSCGHFGRDLYCLLGHGKINFIRKDGKIVRWARPKKCIEENT